MSRLSPFSNNSLQVITLLSRRWPTSAWKNSKQRTGSKKRRRPKSRQDTAQSRDGYGGAGRKSIPLNPAWDLRIAGRTESKQRYEPVCERNQAKLFDLLDPSSQGSAAIG